MKNIVFLDCEFTDLLCPELLSIGMVSMTGEEHYAELDQEHPSSVATLARASDFGRHNGVLEQWGRVPDGASTREQMGHRTAKWLTSQANRFGWPAYVAHDYAADFELLEQVLREVGQWRFVRESLQPLNGATVGAWPAPNEAAERCFSTLAERGLLRHHALADAQALRAAFLVYFNLKGGAQ